MKKDTNLITNIVFSVLNFIFNNIFILFHITYCAQNLGRWNPDVKLRIGRPRASNHAASNSKGQSDLAYPQTGFSTFTTSSYVAMHTLQTLHPHKNGNSRRAFLQTVPAHISDQGVVGLSATS